MIQSTTIVQTDWKTHIFFNIFFLQKKSQAGHPRYKIMNDFSPTLSETIIIVIIIATVVFQSLNAFSDFDSDFLFDLASRITATGLAVIKCWNNSLDDMAERCFSSVNIKNH